VSLAFRTAKGTAWMYAAFFSGRFLGLLTTAVLARLLGSSEFGLFAFAMVVLGIVESLRDLGFKNALIYTPDHVNESADATFQISALFGLSQCFLVYFLAPLAIRFIDDPRIVDILQVLSFSFIINGLAQVQDGLIRKSMRFHKVALAEIYALTIKALITIILAYAGYGLWSLVIGHLLSVVLRTSLLWHFSYWRPKLSVSFKRICAMWGFGIHIVIQKIISAVGVRFDQLIISYYFGGSALGLYYIASRIPELVTSGFSEILTKVLYPAFASVNQDHQALTRALLQSTKFTAHFTVPASVGIFVVAPELIQVVFGSQWMSAVPLVQILSLVGLAQTLPWCAGDVFMAMGRPKINTIIMTIETGVVMLLLWLIANIANEIVAIAWTLLAVTVVSATTRLIVSAKILHLYIGEYISVFRTPFIAGAFMAIVVQSLRWIVSWPSPLLLVSEVLIGGTSYLIALWLLEREVIFQVRDMINAIVRGAPKESTGSATNNEKTGSGA